MGAAFVGSGPEGKKKQPGGGHCLRRTNQAVGCPAQLWAAQPRNRQPAAGLHQRGASQHEALEQKTQTLLTPYKIGEQDIIEAIKAQLSEGDSAKFELYLKENELI